MFKIKGNIFSLFRITGIFLLFFICFINTYSEDGIIDLRKIDFSQKNKTVALDGKWEYYRNELMEPGDIKFNIEKKEYFNVPGKWNNVGDKSPYGYATFRVMVEGLKDSEYGLICKYQYSNYKLWVNGREKMANGVVTTSKKGFVPEYVEKTSFFYPENGKAEIVMQISNYFYKYGGPLSSIYIGKSDSIKNLREKNIAHDGIIFGFFILMALYQFGIFVFRKKDLSALYLSIFLFLTAIRTIVTSGHKTFIADLGYDILERADLLIFAICIPALTMFFYSNYKQETNKIITYFINVGALIGIILTFIKDPKDYDSIIPFIQLVAVIAAFSVLISIIRAFKKKKEWAWLLLLCFAVIFLFIINDILFNYKIINTGYLFSNAIIVLIICYSLILSANFSKAFFINEELNEELKKNNEELKNAMERLKESQEKLVQQEKLAMIGQLAGSITHEIKNPLGAIITNAELLKMDIEDIKVEDQGNIAILISIREEAEAIEIASKQAKNIILGMLNFSRKNTNLQKLQSLKSIIDSILILVKKDLMNEKIKLEVGYEEDITIMGNSGEISQVLLNMIINAKDALLERKEDKKIKINLLKNEKYAIIEIIDNGCGIEAENLEKIFDAYYTTKAEGKGTGLGTAVSLDIMKKHNGKIEVESELEKGTKFSLYFPM